MPGYALVFPGQGSQYIGMGRDLHASSPAARAVFDEADTASQGLLTRLIFGGPAEQLTDTVNAQPAIFAVSMACWAALRASAGVLEPAFVAGHSLGEYSALAAAGVFSFATGLHLVRERGRVMKDAGQAQPGGMAAILGLSAEDVSALCRQATEATGAPVVAANDNAPGQIVISGAHEAVQAASELAKGRGAKRVLPLAVSIAPHSPLMQPAAEHLAPILRQTEFRAPHPPVIGNVGARPLTCADQVMAELYAQLTSPVCWTDSIRFLVGEGISTFIEVGPKDVLTGLIKRIAPEATCIPCGTVEGVEQATRLLREQ